MATTNKMQPDTKPSTALATTAMSSVMHTAAQAGRSMLIGGVLLLIVLLFGCSAIFYFVVAFFDHGWS